MTRKEIMRMEAGRELDMLVAIKLMGGFTVHGDNPWSGPPPYSTDIAAAWEVVERMSSIPTTAIEIRQATNTTFMKLFGDSDLWACTAQEAALTICRLALVVVND